MRKYILINKKGAKIKNMYKEEILSGVFMLLNDLVKDGIFTEHELNFLHDCALEKEENKQNEILGKYVVKYLKETFKQKNKEEE